MPSLPIVHVVAGVLRDAEDRILLTQRPAGKHLAGFWEFPGGKSEPGEAPIDALKRELDEEIGIAVESAQPLISVAHDYEEKRVVLDVWSVDAYAGEPHPREAQAMRWVTLEEMADLPMPPADLPVVAALRLPDRYLITPMFEPSEQGYLLEGIERACRAGIHLIQIRQPSWPRSTLLEAARAAREICVRHGAQLLIHSDWEAMSELGLDGVHLPARIAATLRTRPIGARAWLAVSCHDADELAHARRLGADFVTLSPVAPTPSHPDARALGWPRFAELTREAAMPVFALGGLGPSDIRAARAYGAQGIGAIRELWPARD